MKTAPLLSIGMIFKNELRCIERCMKSLQPLRDAIPCELVMSDTGSDDGSREIAERYADEVFDFPWINDFAAARNAVMDRCTGKWYLSIDCDEWLDEDISEIVSFLQKKKEVDFGFVTIRNYRSSKLEKSQDFADFSALRLVRMSTGERYHRAIHESWTYYEPVEWLTHTVLHHDGYVYVDSTVEKRKSSRNMTLLRRELKENPDSLLILSQCIKSGRDDVDYVQYIRHAVALVQDRKDQWLTLGPSILSCAVEMAYAREMPELQEWIAYAEKEFPSRLSTLVDLQHSAFRAAYDQQNWIEAIRHGELYRKGIKNLRSKHLGQTVKIELSYGTLTYGTPYWEHILLTGLADAYYQNGQAEKALTILETLDGTELELKQLQNILVVLCYIHAGTTIDVLPVLTAFYNQIEQNKPNEQRKKARLTAFNAIAVGAFTPEYQIEEKNHHGYHRPAYTAFRCLAEQCEAGRAATILMTVDPDEIRTWLSKVEDWQAFPIEALEHALQVGVVFPLEEKPLPIEVLDGLAARLTHNENSTRQIVLALSDDEEYSSLQSLFWAQSLALAALGSFDWSLGKNHAPVSKFACPEKKEELDERPEDTPETGLALLRRFAQIESTVLPLLYTPQALAEENAALLPPMHRWGLYCALALNALDSGNPQEYLAILRKGLKACPGEKDMVQFLLDRFMEDARPKASPELLALAEQVRTILAAYDPNDSTVVALKASPAYRQVAWLIEDTPSLPVQ